MAYYDSGGYDTGMSRGGADYSSYSTGSGGGGFLPSTDLTSSQSASSPAAMRGKRDPQSLLPLTIRQLHSASYLHDKFQLDGRDVMQVTVVAQVRSIAALSTNVQYTLNDGTGEILCTVYISEDHPNATRGDVAENCYVRVIGALKLNAQGERRVQGYHVLAIRDHNELTYHQIEAVYTHIKHAGGGAGGKQGAAGHAAAQKGMGGYGATSSSSSSAFMQDHGSSQPHAAGGAGAASSMVLEPSLSAAHNAVLAVFYHNSSDQGASVSEVASMTGMTVQAVAKLVEELSEDGHLYSTIDEEHYKSTRE